MGPRGAKNGRRISREFCAHERRRISLDDSLLPCEEKHLNRSLVSNFHGVKLRKSISSKRFRTKRLQCLQNVVVSLRIHFLNVF